MSEYDVKGGRPVHLVLEDRPPIAEPVLGSAGSVCGSYLTT
jgi:hypothetical protein